MIVAVIAYLIWGRGKSAGTGAAAAGPAAASATPPAAELRNAAASTGPVASYDEYRRVAPSNMLGGKLTCNRCGSNLIAASGGTATCNTCGAALYRA